MSNEQVIAKGGGSTQARFAEGDPLKDYFERNRDKDEELVDQDEIDDIMASHRPRMERG